VTSLFTWGRRHKWRVFHYFYCAMEPILRSSRSAPLGAVRSFATISRWSIVVLGATAMAVLATAMAVLPAQASERPNYVALGDSYASGPAIPGQLTPTTTPGAPTTCLRSSNNYASITARALGLSLNDVSCGGATTKDMANSQGSGIPPQLSAVNSATQVVTVGIGGNDLGYSTIAANCAAYTPWGPTKVGWHCESHYDANGVDQLSANVHRVGEDVAGTLAAIRLRARHAKIFVVGYPDIVPPTGAGCWPKLPFTRDDVAFLRGIETNLNAALEADAAAAGDVFVNMATPSADHSACTSRQTRWVEPIVPSPGSYPLHPDATGMAGMAQVLESAIRTSTVA
jgi:GDSL-like Lipase/Acylhydrolase family